MKENRLQRHHVFRSDRIKVTEELIEKTGGEKVLEIGAGDYSFDYLKSPSADWIRLDFAEPCDIALDINKEDVALPLANDAFDLVICTELLEHLLWPHKLMKEIARVLTPKGQVIVSVPNCSSLTYRLAWMLGRLPSCAASGNLPTELHSTAYQTAEGSTIGGHVIDFNRGRLEQLFQYSGFSVTQTCGTGIIWHRQILPAWSVPVNLSSNIICTAQKHDE